ncbi:MAG: pantoate--beta-alanine ligase [Bacteriovoracaceae bacterium]|jgi:pantoate--beta-alanine ligase
MIKVFHKTLDLQNFLNGKDSIGFVPTMGNLHLGHLSLLSESLKYCKTNVISIFINPTQFSQGEDFNKYPRTLEADIDKIKSLDTSEHEIIIYAPDSELEIYPHGKKVIDAVGPCHILEGALRPGHFDGMATVVKRLFEIVPANKAFFGKKDYQQLTIIKELVKKYEFNTEIIGLPIIREESGLAMSSRNGYLSQEEKGEALSLRQALLSLKAEIELKKPIADIQNSIKTILADKRFNYLELCHQESLETVEHYSNKMILLGNFQVKATKILDNIEIQGME